MPDKDFQLTAKQREALNLFAYPEVKILLLEGGARSAKSFFAVWAIVGRAIQSKKPTKHLILRWNLSQALEKLGVSDGGLLADVFQKAYPEFWNPKFYNHQRNTYRLPHNDAVIYVRGVHGSSKQDQILGSGYTTILCDEVTEFQWATITKLITRRPEEQEDVATKMICTQNPDSTFFWTYKLFTMNRNPMSMEPLPPEVRQKFVKLQMNPTDNVENLGEEELEELRSLKHINMDDYRRFYLGLPAESENGALFSATVFDDNRINAPLDLDKYQELVIAIDPATAQPGQQGDDTEHRALTGIVYGGLTRGGEGNPGEVHTLRDYSGHHRVDQWPEMVNQLYLRSPENTRVVVEVNQGGAMCRQLLLNVNRSIRVEEVHAIKAKQVRMAPAAQMVAMGLVKFVGAFTKMEGELSHFTLTGHHCPHSPNRADAFCYMVLSLLEKSSAMAQGATDADFGLVHGGQGSISRYVQDLGYKKLASVPVRDVPADIGLDWD